MTNAKKIAGILGLAGTFILIVAIIISITSFEDGVYSLTNCFVAELGLYGSGYFTISSALIFNLGLIISGLLFAVFFVMHVLKDETLIHTAFGFFGALTGVLMAAQGVFSLNYPQYHYIVTAAFFITGFITCALYIFMQMRSRDRSSLGFANAIVAFFAGAASVVFAGYTLAGGMMQVFEENMVAARPSVLPFAIVEWAAYLFIVVFLTILAVDLLFFSEQPGYIRGNEIPGLKKSVLNNREPSHENRSDTMDIDL